MSTNATPDQAVDMDHYQDGHDAYYNEWFKATHDVSVSAKSRLYAVTRRLRGRPELNNDSAQLGIRDARRELLDQFNQAS